MSLPSVPPDEAVPTRSRVAERLLQQPLRNLGVGVTVIVLGTTAAFGGLEEAAGGGAGAPGKIEVGKKMTAAPFDITIRRLLWVSRAEMPGIYISEDDNRWLAIVADIENTDDETREPYLAKEALTVSGVDGLLKEPEYDMTTVDEDDRTDRVSADQLLQMADSSDLNPVQPGMTYQAVYLFEQDGTAPTPEKVDVQLVGHTLRPNTFDGQEMWLDPAVVDESGLAVLPMKDSTDLTDAAMETGTDTDTGTDT